MKTPKSAKKVQKPDQLTQMIAFETGELSHEDTVSLFQDLIDSGLAWQLQGFYGLTAMAMIEAGDCHK